MIDRLIGGRRHYAWLIVLVTFVTLITTAGFRATPGVQTVQPLVVNGVSLAWRHRSPRRLWSASACSA